MGNQECCMRTKHKDHKKKNEEEEEVAEGDVINDDNYQEHNRDSQQKYNVDDSTTPQDSSDFLQQTKEGTQENDNITREQQIQDDLDDLNVESFNGMKTSGQDQEFDEQILKDFLNDDNRQNFKIFYKSLLSAFPNILTVMSLYDCQRFFNGRDCDIDQATLMVKNHLDWRIQFQVQKIENFSLSDSDLEKLYSYYPHGFHQTDQQGHPVYYQRYEFINFPEFSQFIKPEHIQKHWIQIYQRVLKTILPRCSSTVGKRIEQIVIVLDLKNYKLNMAQMNTIMQYFQGITRENYPQILFKMFIVNTSMGFKFLWKAASLVIKEKTRNQIEVIGQNLERLYDLIDLENLPDYLGGKSFCGEGQKIEEKGCWMEENQSETL